MNPQFERYIKRVMSGDQRGVSAALLRGVLSLAEPFYTAAVRHRNCSYDRHPDRIHSLPRPVISIGNITTGGTGKTPMVQWLAERLRAQGRRVAILSRGYRSEAGGLGDELSMLDRALNSEGECPVLVRADPDRYSAGQTLLRDHPETDVFVLDDGFQHRRLARDLNIVLVNATEPFGFGHVLPRGLLREPLSGLGRAHAMVITHADRVSPEALTFLESTLRRFNPTAPITRARHAPIAALDGSDRHRLEELADRPFFAFCGIGSPGLFDLQLSQFGDAYRGKHFFTDHHRYTASDLRIIEREAITLGAQRLLTTEKDWVKVKPLASGTSLPIWRLQMRMEFLEADESVLWDQVRSAMRC